MSGTIKDLVKSYIAQFRPTSSGTMNAEQKLQEYAFWETLVVELETEMKEAAKQRDTVEVAIMEHFTNEGMTSAKVPGLGTFSKTSSVRASIKADMKEKGLAAFKEFYPDMVQETINAQTLSGFVNNSQKNDIPIEPRVLECLSIFRKEFISWRR